MDLGPGPGVVADLFVGPAIDDAAHQFANAVEGKRPRGRYKTTNWAEYNVALKARGSLTVWLETDMQWYAPATGKRGNLSTTPCLRPSTKSLRLSVNRREPQVLQPELCVHLAFHWNAADFCAMAR